MKTGHNFIVLGGAGTIGRIVVHDLFESDPKNIITIADYQMTKAEILAQSFKDRRVQSVFIDARDSIQLTKQIAGHQVVINCLQHDFNLAVMKAALAAKVHYIDLGGLFSWTRKQLLLNEEFRKAGLTAVIGMGCAPGITNVLAAHAASKLEKIRSVKIRVGSIDFNKIGDRIWFPYSHQTVIEELTLKPWLFKNGRFGQISPRRGWECVGFPAPVGKTWTFWTRHSEVATLPLSFRSKGIQYCDFKVSFDREFVKEIIRRLEAGWTLEQFKTLPIAKTNPNDYEISRVTVDKITVDCHARAKPKWQASASDIDTGCPASIVAQMIANGQIDRRGVFRRRRSCRFNHFSASWKNAE
jgi:saccharopine dehydrogenase-like NADP-dependent oxidoreductase